MFTLFGVGRSVLQVPDLGGSVRGPLEPSRVRPGGAEHQPGAQTQAEGSHNTEDFRVSRSVEQGIGSGSALIRIHFPSWIRIQ